VRNADGSHTVTKTDAQGNVIGVQKIPALKPAPPPAVPAPADFAMVEYSETDAADVGQPGFARDIETIEEPPKMESV